MSHRSLVRSLLAHSSTVGRVLLVLALAAPMTQCINGSPDSPTPVSPTVPTPPAATLSAVTVTGLSGAATPGETAQLTASASYSDGRSETVTAQATWASTNTAVATVSASGVVTFVALGETDIRATYQSMSGAARVTVTAAPVRRFALTGVLTDADNRRGVENVRVEVVDGPDAGRVATTNVDGVFSLGELAEGSFNVRITHPYFEVVVRAVTLSAPVRLEIALRPLINVQPLYGVFNVSLRETRQTCEEPPYPAPNGTLTLSGNADGSGFRAVIVERGTTRVYGGSMRADGSFSGSGGGVFAGAIGRLPGPIFKHDFTGTISGRVTGNNVSGTESVTFGAPCPGRVLSLDFSGSK
jgi:hypothetical protein